MKLPSTKHSTVLRANRVLPIGICGILALSLVVACGKPDGGKEFFKQGVTPPAAGKPSSKRFFSDDDDQDLSKRLAGASATVVAGSDGKSFVATASFVVADPVNSSVLRMVVGTGPVNPGTDGPPTAKASAADSQGEIDDSAGLTTSSAVATTQPQATTPPQTTTQPQATTQPPASAQPQPTPTPQPGQSKPQVGQLLDTDVQKSSPGVSTDNYVIRAVCEDPQCNTLHVRLAEKNLAASDGATKAETLQGAGAKKSRRIKLVFTRSGGGFRLASCPADPGGAGSAQSISDDQQRTLRARGFIVARSASEGTAAAASACAQIPSFETASKKPGVVPVGGTQPAAPAGAAQDAAAAEQSKSQQDPAVVTPAVKEIQETPANDKQPEKTVEAGAAAPQAAAPAAAAPSNQMAGGTDDPSGYQVRGNSVGLIPAGGSAPGNNK